MQENENGFVSGMHLFRFTLYLYRVSIARNVFTYKVQLNPYLIMSDIVTTTGKPLIRLVLLQELLITIAHYRLLLPLIDCLQSYRQNSENAINNTSILAKCCQKPNGTHTIALHHMLCKYLCALKSCSNNILLFISLYHLLYFFKYIRRE